MIIEKARYEDLAEILTLQKLAYRSEAELCNDFTILPLMQTLEETREEYCLQLILKAGENGAIIGSVRAYEEEGVCYIGKLIVHPNRQNQGIGKEILKAIEACFRECRKYALFTGKDSLRNLYFYQKAGYRIGAEKALNDRVTLVFLEKDNRDIKGNGESMSCR